jgi:hypothetical protein
MKYRRNGTVTHTQQLLANAYIAVICTCTERRRCEQTIKKNETEFFHLLDAECGCKVDNTAVKCSTTIRQLRTLQGAEWKTALNAMHTRWRRPRSGHSKTHSVATNLTLLPRDLLPPCGTVSTWCSIRWPFVSLTDTARLRTYRHVYNFRCEQYRHTSDSQQFLQKLLPAMQQYLSSGKGSIAQALLFQGIEIMYPGTAVQTFE